MATLNEHDRIIPDWRIGGKITQEGYDRFGVHGKYPIVNRDRRSAYAAIFLYCKHHYNWWSLSPDEREFVTIRVYQEIVKRPKEEVVGIPQYLYIARSQEIPPSWDISDVLNVSRPNYKTPVSMHFGNPFIPLVSHQHSLACQHDQGVGITANTDEQAVSIAIQLYEYWIQGTTEYDGKYNDMNGEPIIISQIEHERAGFIRRMLPWIYYHIHAVYCRCYDEFFCHSQILREYAYACRTMSVDERLTSNELDVLNASYWGWTSTEVRNTKDGLANNFMKINNPVQDKQVSDICYHDVETGYQAAKVSVNTEYGKEWRRYIASAKHAGEAKHRAREFEKRIQENSDGPEALIAHRPWYNQESPKSGFNYKVMKAMLKHKYAIGTLWALRLIQSGHRPIVEWNYRGDNGEYTDVIWGRNTKTEQGLNLLGECIDEVRDELYYELEQRLSQY